MIAFLVDYAENISLTDIRGKLVQAIEMPEESYDSQDDVRRGLDARSVTDAEDAAQDGA